MKKIFWKGSLLLALFVLLCLPLTAAKAEAAVVPGKVVLVSAEAISAKQIQISWKKTKNVTHYRVYRKENKRWIKLDTLSADTLSYTHISTKEHPIKAGEAYTYTVRGYNQKSNMWGDFEVAGLTVYAKPAKVVLQNISGTVKKVTLNWKKAAAATHYCIYYKEEGGSWKRIARINADQLTYVHNSSNEYPLEKGKFYAYTVRAYSSLSKSYGEYDSKGLNIGFTPPVTKLLSAKEQGRSVVLSWDKTQGATDYYIYYKEKNGSWKKITSIPASYGTTFVHKTTALYPIAEGKTYVYTVRAYNSRLEKLGPYDTDGVSVKIPVNRLGAQKSTLKKLLQTGLEPVGSTMYIYGGAWDVSQHVAGEEARTIGVSPVWESFFRKQNSSYNHRDHMYEVHNGIDCSGFIGWCIYNIMNTESGKDGYVMASTKMAREYAALGWGSYTPAGSVRDFKAGDIMSTTGHVYMVVGQCDDGSVVILHSSPPGVQLCGTPSRAGLERSQAVILAEKYMKTFYPQWYAKFPECSRGSSYLTSYGQMRWDISGSKVMTDPDGYRNKNAGQVLADLFGTVL